VLPEGELSQAEDVEKRRVKGRNPGYESKRMEILQKAAIAFADDGYHQTSVNSLAERIGVSKPVLYYYARNKDDLLFQIGLVAREQLQDAMDHAQRSRVSGMAKVRRFLTTYAGIMCGDFGRCFALVDPQSLSPEARDSDVRHRRILEQSVQDMIAEGQADGSIRGCDPALTSRALFGAFNGIPRWFRKDGELSSTDVAEAYIDLFVIGMGRG
jgi:TetR/AcrR family transcriptional regulator, cholesterol catabolism regulator